MIIIILHVVALIQGDRERLCCVEREGEGEEREIHTIHNSQNFTETRPSAHVRVDGGYKRGKHNIQIIIQCKIVNTEVYNKILPVST